MRRFTLPNGIRCVIKNHACHQTVTVNIMFRVGSRDEPKSYYGLTHFAEHMFFKGTKNRPKAEMISSEIDQYGGLINAVTDHDITFYYIKINRQHFDTALDVLSDMLFHSLFESKEIKSEKEVVVEELQMYRSNPNRHIHTLLSQSLFKHTTLEHDIGGDIKTIRLATREKFLAFLSHFYQPENIVISIVGNLPISESKVKAKVKSYFNQKFYYLPTKTLKKYNHQTFQKKRKLFPNFHQLQKSLRFHSSTFPEMKNTYLMLGFPAFPVHSNGYYVALMISAILGGGMSSRLFIEVREKRGLVYKIATNVDSYEDLGSFNILAATSGPPSKIKKVIQLILNELKKIKDGKFTNKDIHKAREYLIGTELMRRESSSYLAEKAAYNLITFNRLISPDEYFDRLHEVTKQGIIQGAKKMFQWEKLNLVTISKTKLTQKQLLETRHSI